MHATLKDIPVENMAFAVLTLDRRHWNSRYDAFKALYFMWDKLRKRLNRWFSSTWSYVTTVELHRDGYPHLNLLFVGPSWRSCRRHWRSMRKKLEWHARACGFGKRTYLGPVRGRDAIAGYTIKAARELEKPITDERIRKMVGESIKQSQVPVNAPKGFRRLRSSQRFLQSPFASDEKTSGALVEDDKVISAPDGMVLEIDTTAGMVYLLEHGPPEELEAQPVVTYLLRTDPSRDRSRDQRAIMRRWSYAGAQLAL
jgi:hypothetical protein